MSVVRWCLARWRRAASIGLAAAFALPAPASAQSERTATPTRDRTEFTLLGGFGYGVKINSGQTEEQLLVLEPQVGIRLSPHFDYVIEGHLAKDFRPSGFAAGLVPVGARYRLATAPLDPYVALGVGVVWTNLDVVELSRRFNFIVQGGLGVQGAGGAWTVEARFLHYSNANTVLPNLGLNSVVLLLGWRLP